MYNFPHPHLPNQPTSMGVYSITISKQARHKFVSDINVFLQNNVRNIMDSKHESCFLFFVFLESYKENRYRK